MAGVKEKTPGDSSDASLFSKLADTLSNQEDDNRIKRNTSNGSLPKESPARRITRKISTLLLATSKMKTLAPIESSPIILIRFTPKATPAYIRLIKERLKQARIMVVTEEADSEGNVMLGISTTQSELELEAEHLSFYKPKMLKNLSGSMALFEGTVIMEQFEVADRASFLTNAKQDDLAVYDRSGIFTSADRVKIVHSLVESLTVLKPGDNSSELARKFNEILNI